MEYISVKETSDKWGISVRCIQKLCEENRILGVFCLGRSWAIPKDAPKPADARVKSGKYVKAQNK